MDKILFGYSNTFSKSPDEDPPSGSDGGSGGVKPGTQSGDGE